MRKLLIILSMMLGFALFCGTASAEVTFQGCVYTGEETFIDLGAMEVTDLNAFAEFLWQMPKLQQVNMFETKLDKDGCRLLADLFPNMKWGWTMILRGSDHTHEIRTDQTSFSTLHGRCPNHYTEDFYPLRYCRNLVALDLGHNYVDDISFLSNFPGMKVLILACNNISDISVLAELKELEYLELFSNRIKDFTPLLELTHLKDLNISNNPVSDITPLYAMTHLERFWSGMNRNVRSQVREMEKLLPDCEIFWDGEPTWGGWREHHRYDTIYAIFNEGGYRPFEK